METIKDFFDIKELVDEQVYNVHGESAWKFFDKDALDALLTVRTGLGKSITVNNWSWGGNLRSRGLRHNQTPLVKKKSHIYLSAHMMGRAFDFDVEDMTATEVRKWIEDNAHLFKCKIRLERKYKGKEISWVHLDNYSEEKNPKVYLFDI